jgi:hypothetical protein
MDKRTVAVVGDTLLNSDDNSGEELELWHTSKKCKTEVKEVTKAEVKAEVKEEKTEGTEDHVLCNLCQNVPCLLKQGLYDSLSELQESFDLASQYDYLSNKEIRYRLYRHASFWIEGPLGKGRRKELPPCVVAEIHDFAPEDNVDHYVGFKEVDK